jgi:serine/threonine protein kinase
MSLVYRFAVDIARAVKYLHNKQHIVQRDLKARNVLVDSSLNAKVADFGLSREIQASGPEAHLTACGTPAWTAPEVVRGERYTDKVDVYSFGIIMWELISRKEPYGGKKGISVAYAAAQQGTRPEIPAFSPAPYTELMKHCWADQPQDRPTFNSILSRLFAMKKSADSLARE